METSIRAGIRPFYATDIFPKGLSRSSYFNKRESDELICYGYTLSALLSGELSPENEEESQFIHDINMSEDTNLYMVNLWRKYLNAVQKSKSFHGFSPSSRSVNIDLSLSSSNDRFNVKLAG